MQIKSYSKQIILSFIWWEFWLDLVSVGAIGAAKRENHVKGPLDPCFAFGLMHS
jgi:hypothetical protein